MSEDVLFNSAADALRFAFNFSHQQYDRPLMNRMIDIGSGSGKGLSGMDGAAQAGMIRREISTLPNLQLAVITARFAPRSFPCSCTRPCCSGQTINFEWREAVRCVAAHACEELPGGIGKFRLRHELVMRYYTGEETLTAIAERCGVRRQAASDHNSLITSWLRGTQPRKGKEGIKGEEAKAIGAARSLLTSCGMVQES